MLYNFQSFEPYDGDGLLPCDYPLNPESALAAHQQGAFPWYERAGEVMWWRPALRAVFLCEAVHLSRRTRRELRQSALRGDLQFTVDNDFAGVISACATEHGRSWILPEMQRVYQTLHTQGWAHSVEVWHQQQLVAGVYGVALGQVFCAESMFHRRRNTSKMALWVLAQVLRARGIGVMDTQMLTEHLYRLGARLITDMDYQTLLTVDPSSQRGSWRALVGIEDLL